MSAATTRAVLGAAARAGDELDTLIHGTNKSRLEVTMTVLVFGVHGRCPVPEGSHSAWRAGGRVVVSHTGGRRLVAWREAVTAAALQAAGQAGWPPGYDGPVAVSVCFWMPRPARPRFALHPATRPDLDKLIRAVGDALAPRGGGGILAEDSRITSWAATKTWAHQRGQEGVTVTVTALPLKAVD